MHIHHLDHLVLTVASIEKTSAFYCRVLGMKEVIFGKGRVALLFGRQKINLHEIEREIKPCAANPTPGSADLCFIATGTIEEIEENLNDCGVEILLGPVARTGATGPITSIYFRDPDENLIEVSVYV